MDAAADVEALCRRRSIHRRDRTRATHARQAERDPEACARCVRHHRGQALLRSRRDRLGARRRRRWPQPGEWVIRAGLRPSMQLARNVFPERISREKTLTRKLKEAKVARQIEAKYPKGKILELYLNQIYLGNGAYGVETASQRYFEVGSRSQPRRTATLASLPKGRALQPAALSGARDSSAETPWSARAARRHRQSGRRTPRPRIPAPARAARRGGRHGAVLCRVGAPAARRSVRLELCDGLRVYTTLDIDMQSAAERAPSGSSRRWRAASTRAIAT